MSTFIETFKANLVGFDFETLELFPHSIFAVSSELNFIYFNKGWFDFARSNEGEPAISERFTIGSSFSDAIKGEAQSFYVDNYLKVIKNLKTWRNEYECSSPHIYRLFFQEVFPLKNGTGAVIINSLKIEREFTQDLDSVKANLSEYVTAKGLITQCTNCRKTQLVSDSKVWHWVPSLVERMPRNVSHSIYPICFDYYWKYRNFDD